MKRFILEESFCNLFPSASIGVIVLEHFETDGLEADKKAALEALLEAAQDDVQAHLPNSDFVSNPVIACWREAYRQFKTKKGARSSIENLLKRSYKGNAIKPINPLVDIYNVVSLRFAFPVGGEDIDTFVGDLRLGITQGGDAFRALGEDKDEPSLEGELCYRDEAGAVCRCWNWRDGVRTALTNNSCRAFLIIENVQEERKEDLMQALDVLEELACTYLGGRVFAKEILSASGKRECIIEE